MDALALLARTEGIIAAIESAHALAGAFDVARELGPEGLVLVNLSGRGDKDMETAREWFGLGQKTAQKAAQRTAQKTRRSVSVRRPSRRPARTTAPRWSATCPPASPTSQGGIDAIRAMVDAGCDVIEVGLPYSDPVMDGPTIQAAAQQALDRGVRTTDVLRTVEAVAATGTPDRRDDLLEPRRALRRRPVRARPRRRRGSGADHPRPHAGRRPALAGRRGRARPRQGLPGRAVLDRRADRDDRRRLPRLRLRHRRHGRHRHPRHHQRAGRTARRPHQGGGVRSRGRPARRRGARRQQRRPGRRGRVVRRRGDRRARRSSGRCSTTPTTARPGCARSPRSPRTWPGEYAVRRAAVGSRRRSRSSLGLAGCGGDDVTAGDLHGNDPRPAVHGVPGRAGRHRRRAPTRWPTAPTSGSPWSSSATPTAPTSAAS